MRHFVYTYVNAADAEKTGMGHFDSEAEIEVHVRGHDIQSTIVRPASFVELLMLSGMGLDKDLFTSFIRRDRRAQLIAERDVGRIVTSIFATPEDFFGRTIEIA